MLLSFMMFDGATCCNEVFRGIAVKITFSSDKRTHWNPVMNVRAIKDSIISSGHCLAVMMKSNSIASVYTKRVVEIKMAVQC